MDWIASQITSLPVVCSIVYSDVNQRKHQSSASLAFVREIHRGPVNFPHKWPVTRKMFPFDDVIMLHILQNTKCVFIVAFSNFLNYMNALEQITQHRIFNESSVAILGLHTSIATLYSLNMLCIQRWYMRLKALLISSGHRSKDKGTVKLRYEIPRNTCYLFEKFEGCCICAATRPQFRYHYVIMSAMASQIISLKIVYSTIYSRCRSEKTSKLRVIGLYDGDRWIPLKKGQYRGKMFPFNDIIMQTYFTIHVIAIFWWQSFGLWRLENSDCEILLMMHICVHELSSLVWIMTCCLFSVKQLPGPIPTHYQLEPQKDISV